MPGGAWRIVTLVAVVAAALASPASPAAVRGATLEASAVQSLNTLESGVLVEINALRRRHGLAPLRTSSALRAAADAHSLAMARHGFFAHDSRDGSAFWKRIARFYGSKRYAYWAVGENLLWSSPDVDPERALEMWMASPPHRKVLLTRRWREIGLSAVRVVGAPGTFGGREVTILTADFGVRR